MASQATAKKQVVSPIMHLAPAGRNYTSIKEAGRALLDTYFSGFLKGESHQIIPAILANECPEEVDSEGFIVPGPGFSRKDLTGENNKKLGEDLEIKVSKQIEKIFGIPLSASGFTDPQLFWRGLTIPKYKMAPLLREHPEITLKAEQFLKKHTKKHATTYGESDIMCLVQDRGLIVVEIKRSVGHIKDGIKQCQKIQDFASLVFETCSDSIALPVVKVVIVDESKDNKPPTAGAPSNSTVGKPQGVTHVVKEEPSASSDATEKSQEVKMVEDPNPPTPVTDSVDSGAVTGNSNVL